MSEALQETTDLPQFETVNINLAAVLLSEIPGSQLLKIDPKPTVDGKRLLTVGYPASQEEVARRVITRFLNRELSVNLYAFNRWLNRIRDALHGREDTRGG